MTLLVVLKNISIFLPSASMVRLTATFASFPLLNKQLIGGVMIRNGVVGAMAIFLFPVVSQHINDKKTCNFCYLLFVA